MTDFKIPIIRTPEQKKFQKSFKEVRISELRQHQRWAENMTPEELEANRVDFFDRWCWETGDATDRVISEMYSFQLSLRNMLSVQPMGTMQTPEYSLKYSYTPSEPEDDT